MKKIILLSMIVAIIALAGCEKESLTINNLEYVRLVEAERNTFAIFEKEDGKEKVLYLDNDGKNIIFSMETGKFYNVTFTVDTITTYGDFLLSAELANE